MAKAVKRLLSASTDGKGIAVAATASPGTLIHTAVAGTTAGNYDEVWLGVHNTSGAVVTLTLEWGDATNPIKLDVPILGSGVVSLMQGMCLQNAATVRAFASTASALSITGFVNRIED